VTTAPELSLAIRATILASAAVTVELADYAGSYPVFTQVPVPADAPYPMIATPNDIPGGDEDGVADLRPVIVRDVNIYGYNDTPAHSRQVDRIAQAVWGLFHRQRGSIAVSGWSTVSVVAVTPAPAPTDDEQIAGRRVELTVRLAKQV
jgi:hypothetical protein